MPGEAEKPSHGTASRRRINCRVAEALRCPAWKSYVIAAKTAHGDDRCAAQRLSWAALALACLRKRARRCPSDERGRTGTWTRMWPPLQLRRSAFSGERAAVELGQRARFGSNGKEGPGLDWWRHQFVARSPVAGSTSPAAVWQGWTLEAGGGGSPGKAGAKRQRCPYVFFIPSCCH